MTLLIIPIINVAKILIVIVLLSDISWKDSMRTKYHYFGTTLNRLLPSHLALNEMLNNCLSFLLYIIWHFLSKYSKKNKRINKRTLKWTTKQRIYKYHILAFLHFVDCKPYYFPTLHITMKVLVVFWLMKFAHRYHVQMEVLSMLVMHWTNGILS